MASNYKCGWDGYAPHSCNYHTAVHGLRLGGEDQEDNGLDELIKRQKRESELYDLEQEIRELEDRLPIHRRLRECLIELGKLLAENPDE